jgi:hypothetical protein
MKTRGGFVSNSSSSSFIVVFPQKPKSLKEVKKRLFNNQDGIIDFCDIKISHDFISTRVYHDLCNIRKASRSELYELFLRDVEIYSSDLEHCYQSGESYQPELEHLTDSEPLQLLQINYANCVGDYEQEQALVRGKYNEPDYSNAVDNPYYETLNLELKRIKIIYDKKESEFNNRIESEIKLLASEITNRYMSEHKGWWYGILSYCDESGEEESALEHGFIFRHIESFRYSNH